MVTTMLNFLKEKMGIAKEINDKNVYIYYSGATDKTGGNLKTALGIAGDRKAPAKSKKYPVVIGWGAKTKDSVNLGTSVVLNHPDKIRDNRNKAKALVKMAEGAVNVAAFTTADRVLVDLDTADSGINLPIIGRKNYHQGGTGFWLCITKSQVQTAMNEGAQYFQNFLDIKDEFRLHVMCGELVYAVKKVKRDNVQEAFVEQTTEALKHNADKNKVDLDQKTLDFVTKRLSKDQDKVDMVVRSNKRGWRFSRIQNDKVDPDLLAEALKAITALELDFGAVDCCIDADGRVWIIEVNTGPGLEGTPFDSYVEAFKKHIDVILNPKKKEKAATAKTNTKGKASKVAADGSTKAQMIARLDAMKDLLEGATDEEAKTLESVAARCWGGSSS